MIETIAGISAAALVVGITELVKKYSYINERYIPLVPFIFSALLFLVVLPQYSIEQYITSVIVYGLVANGIYSGVKKLRDKDKRVKRL